ncbi:macro domain-containing protein [Chloracidobacterium thermophilum]|uniref:macro domain-containing protein n=1 Tax=Chloracidobacterium thermophilum TaxID=458033 RepID=UPI001BB2D458|nr:macro domain-containing protein [Chloracidobacterium thermophilum]QUV80461.1 macro domain-containing protein [Chloracidobacterium thermophilum]
MEFTSGDLLKCEAEALVNTVNCVGVMGRGIALHFRQAFLRTSRLTKLHASAKPCSRRMFVFETGQLTPPRFIINFPTKRHWRSKSRIEDIEAGLGDLVKVIRDRNIRSSPFRRWDAAWVAWTGMMSAPHRAGTGFPDGCACAHL